MRRSYLHGVNRRKQTSVEGRLNLVDLAGNGRGAGGGEVHQPVAERAEQRVYQHPEQREPRELPRHEADAAAEGLSVEGGQDADVREFESRGGVRAGEFVLAELRGNRQSGEAGAGEEEGGEDMMCFFSQFNPISITVLSLCLSQKNTNPSLHS